jgi:hypothetical protein
VKMKRKAGGVRVDLTEVEANLLAGLIDDFATMLAEDADPADPVQQRLFPNGYTDDAEASAEYREMVEADLRTERIGRLQLCRAELPEQGGRLTLDDEAADRWLRVLNDLRLTLGTRLGVSEEVELDPTEPVANIYHWLSAVQDVLIDNVM